MRNVFICLFVLFVFASSSFSAQEYGRIKVLPPTEDCEVMIDGIQVGTGTTSTRIAAGMHNVVVNLKDGTPLYKEQVEVIADEIATVAVSYELKKKNKSEPESGKVSIKSKKDRSDEQDEEPAKEWGEGFGLSIGADNTNYTIAALGDSETLDLGGQLDLSLFYAGKLGEGIYGEVSGSLLRTYGSFDNGAGTKTSVTAFPICLDLKFKVNENMMLGAGVNYSYWA
jgi:hypothetical protein